MEPRPQTRLAFQLGVISLQILRTEVLTGLAANGNFFLLLLKMDRHSQIIASQLELDLRQDQYLT
jgi:hypothetical protein